MYYKAGVDQERQRLRDLAIAFGVAQSGDQKVFNKFLDSLAPKKTIDLKVKPNDIRRRKGLKTPRQQWEEQRKKKRG